MQIESSLDQAFQSHQV
jgi:DNA-directed RNA polymerase II subunit RPB3